MDPIVARVFVVIYAVLATAVAFLMWKNAGSEDALKNAGIAVASILPVLVAVLPYLRREQKSVEYDYALIYDSHENRATLVDHGIRTLAVI